MVACTERDVHTKTFVDKVGVCTTIEGSRMLTLPVLDPLFGHLRNDLNLVLGIHLGLYILYCMYNSALVTHSI
jgi:hypothetical protein